MINLSSRKMRTGNSKKGVTAQVISVFILVLIVSILSGMTFLFTTQLKTEVQDTTSTSYTTYLETGAINDSGHILLNSTLLGFDSLNIINVTNNTDSVVIDSANYTVNSDGLVRNATEVNFANVNFTYSFTAIAPDDQNAYLAVNKTEGEGYNTTKYLSLLFLALIFGAILMVVLRVMLPYINVGRSMGSDF